MKKFGVFAMGAVLSLSISACSKSVSKPTYESVSIEASQANQELIELKASVEMEINANNSKYESLSADFEAYKQSMAEYEGLASAEAEAREIEAKAIAESKSAEESAAVAAKAAEEEAAIIAAAAQKEAEEKTGYETGITYDQLARTPDDYKGKKVKFTGKVIQVLEGTEEVQIRFAVNSDYDTVIYGAYLSTIVSSRVLEDDKITIYGTSNGLLSYESTMGGTITIPSIIINKIDQ